MTYWIRGKIVSDLEEKRRYSEIYQFLLSSDAKSLYEDASEAIILRAVYESAEAVSIKDIKDILDNLFNIENYPDGFISNRISNLEEKEQIIKSNEKYFLSPKTEERLKDAVSHYDRIKENFFEELEKSFSENSLNDVSLTKIKKFTYDFLGKLYSEIGSKCAELRSGKPSSSDPWIKEFNEGLDYAIEKNFKNNEEKVRTSFLSILEEPTKETSSFLHTLLESYILSSTLNIDPEMKGFQEAEFSEITIYLDTNILINLVCRKNNHKVIENILENTHQLGINIKISERSIEEFRGKLSGADKKISKKEDNGSDPFIEHFYMDSSSEEWQSYYRKMYNIGDFLEEYSIDGIEKISQEELIDTEEYSKIYDKVEKASFDRGSYFTPKKRPKTIEHDAILLLSIKKIVDSSDIYSWIGPSDIFLTNDAYLPDIRSEDDFPVSFQVDEWNQIIHPFISPKAAEENSEEVYAHLFASKFPELSRITETSPESLIKEILPSKDFEKINPSTLKKILSKEHVKEKMRDYSEAPSSEKEKTAKEELKRIIRKEIEDLVKEEEKSEEKIGQAKRRVKKSQSAFTLLKYTVGVIGAYLITIIGTLAFFQEYVWSIITLGVGPLIAIILFIWGWGFINKYSWSDFIDLLR